MKTRMLMVLSLLLCGTVMAEQDAMVEPATVETLEVVAMEPEAPETQNAEEAATPLAAESEDVAVPATVTFAVLLPERIDHDWYWILYSDVSQHIVQSAIEKALVRAGLDVVDVNASSLSVSGNDLQQLTTVGFARQAGSQLKVDYVINGNATAVKSSEGQAYGVTVYRSQAEVVARIVRVSDGKVMAMEDASQLEGGQSAQAAGQAALKKAGASVASNISRTARSLANPEPTAP